MIFIYLCVCVYVYVNSHEECNDRMLTCEETMRVYERTSCRCTGCRQSVYAVIYQDTCGTNDVHATAIVRDENGRSTRVLHHCCSLSQHVSWRTDMYRVSPYTSGNVATLHRPRSAMCSAVFVITNVWSHGCASAIGWSTLSFSATLYCIYPLMSSS